MPYKTAAASKLFAVRPLSGVIREVLYIKYPLIKITDDLFDIAWRLRGVKQSYRLYFNVAKKRYEVHDEEQKPNTLAFVSPYEEPDCRLVEYAAYSRTQNASEILGDIERHNERVRRNAADAALNEALEKYERRRNYESNRRGKDMR